MYNNQDRIFWLTDSVSLSFTMILLPCSSNNGRLGSAKTIIIRFKNYFYFAIVNNTYNIYVLLWNLSHFILVLVLQCTIIKRRRIDNNFPFHMMYCHKINFSQWSILIDCSKRNDIRIFLSFGNDNLIIIPLVWTRLELILICLNVMKRDKRFTFIIKKD